MWALHNHPQRILQLSIGSRLPIEAQDAIIQELKTMREFNQYITFLSGDYVRHFEDSTDVEVTVTIYFSILPAKK